MFSIGESCDDGAEYGRSVASSESNWHFLFVLYVIFMFLALDVVCLIVYNRQTLLEIGSTITHHKPDFKFLNTGLLFTNNTAEPFVWAARPQRRKQSQRRGKRAGDLVRLRRRADRSPLPSILLANVQSLYNKLCELRVRIYFQCEIRDCSIICLTETWMSREVPDFCIAFPYIAQIECRISQGRAK